MASVSRSRSGSLAMASTGALMAMAQQALYSSSSRSVPSTRRSVMRVPYYCNTMAKRVALHKLQQEFPNTAYGSGVAARLYDYEQIGDIVRTLPTIADKIAFINPYQRQWTHFEKTWHRAWLPALMCPRKAWNVPSVPRYFDALNFYKYITKTRVVEGLNQYYEGIIPATNAFQKRLTELLAWNFESNVTSNSEHVNRLLRGIADAALFTVAHHLYRSHHFRVSLTPRCESFWIRSGFLRMYEKKQLDKNEAEIDRRSMTRFTADDRRKLGELVFVLRDNLAVQIRSRHPLQALFPFSNQKELCAEVFDEVINPQEDVIYSPKVFNMWPDEEPLWQCPGFEPESGEQEKYGILALKDVSVLNDLCKMWKIDGVEECQVRKNLLTASCVVSLFSWLNGQAHSIGFTQYNDIEWPLVSQLILSDGCQFFFAIAQLNTLAINIDIEGFINNRSNVCYVEGPLSLYDRYDSTNGNFYYMTTDGSEVNGLNPAVMARILQMFMKE